MNDTDTLSKPFITVPPWAQPILRNIVLAEEQKDKRFQLIRNRSKMEKNENQPVTFSSTSPTPRRLRPSTSPWSRARPSRNISPPWTSFSTSLRERAGIVEIGNERKAVSRDTLIESPKGIPHCWYNESETVFRVLVVKAPRPSAAAKLL